MGSPGFYRNPSSINKYLIHKVAADLVSSEIHPLLTTQHGTPSAFLERLLAEVRLPGCIRCGIYFKVR